uniref:Cingulin n=1 Tax=Salarias fasciatus TaxID=181472 RepID=A0A672J5L0_SALFA
MSGPSSGRRTPADHGVQIRFINDLHGTGGGPPAYQPKPKAKAHNSKYGVAVRVQGIAGQPYVVLKDGQKGDSYGVQLKTQAHSGSSSLPRRRDRAELGAEGVDVGGGERGGQGGGADSASNSDPALKAELESCLDENLQLQEMLDRKKKELNDTQSELTQLRMDRESAEARVRGMEDQLAELQDELRRENGSRTDVASYQTQLMELSQVRQKLEETLRQRERELTALKGALKDEVATHDKEIEVLRDQYRTDMEKLRGSMEQVSQSHAGIEAERQRVNSSVRSLQQQLEDCRDESSHWMEQFHNTRDELRTAKQEDSQPGAANFQQSPQDTLSHKNASLKAARCYFSAQELQRSNAELKKAKAEVDKQRTEFDKKVMEVISIKKTHQQQEAELKYEIDRLKDQLQRSKDDFTKAQEKNKRVDIDSHKEAQQEQEAANARLKEKLSRLEVSSRPHSSEAELALHAEVRGLRSELDEAKRKASRLSQEHRELTLRLEDSDKDKDALKQTVSQLEEAKRQQERAIEKLTKDNDSLTVSSRDEVQALRVQLEEQRERARKEMQEAQRQGTDAHSELERSHANLRRLEEELSRQKKELLLACEERDNHQLDKELLANRLRHLEGEMETHKNSHNEKTREVRLLEDKLKRLELEFEEEKSNAEMMTDRVSRSRDQIDQLRAELMQERSSKQDLELDKNALERQLKELRSRVADMEGHSRSSAGVSQLESKIQELEERLLSEDREKTSMLASQRRLERKLKELNMTLDEERQSHTEQKDQLALKVKALKRQVDESETELERIDALRRKAQRDVEEQMELKDALQSRVTALETELNSSVSSIKTCLPGNTISHFNKV